MAPELVALLVAGLAVGLLACLTALGEWRRAQGWGIALVAGAFFPITWTVWYLRDERPYRTPKRG